VEVDETAGGEAEGRLEPTEPWVFGVLTEEDAEAAEEEGGSGAEIVEGESVESD
jgi:hypothetical protein